MNQSPKIISYGVRLVMILAVSMLVFSQPGPAQAAPHLSDTVSQPAIWSRMMTARFTRISRRLPGWYITLTASAAATPTPGVSPTQAWKTLTKF